MVIPQVPVRVHAEGQRQQTIGRRGQQQEGDADQAGTAIQWAIRWAV